MRLYSKHFLCLKLLLVSFSSCFYSIVLLLVVFHVNFVTFLPPMFIFFPLKSPFSCFLSLPIISWLHLLILLHPTSLFPMFSPLYFPSNPHPSSLRPLPFMLFPHNFNALLLCFHLSRFPPLSPCLGMPRQTVAEEEALCKDGNKENKVKMFLQTVGVLMRSLSSSAWMLFCCWFLHFLNFITLCLVIQ